MNKTGLSLKMLAILSNGRLYKISELAEKLEVTERKILELREELEIADFRIEGIRGKYGGYRLDKHSSRLITTFNINNEELNSLKFIQKTLIDEQNNHNRNFSNVINKIETVIKQDNTYDFQVIQPLNYNRLHELEDNNFLILNKAIKECKKVKFLYKTLEAKLKEFIIAPYELYFYKGFWYLINYYEKKNKAYHYKLVRMNKIEIIEETYKKSPQYKLCDFTGETSIFQDEKYFIELVITPPSSIFISELLIAKDQEIIENNDGSIIFKGTMEGKVEIVAWLLSIGKDIRDISPIEIKEEYLKQLEVMTNNFN